MERELAHYGVVGMKWGIRREALKDSRVQSARAKYKSDNKEWTKAASKAGNTRNLFNKKKKDAAIDNAWDKMHKSIASEKAYKKEYERAKTEATKNIHKKGYDKATVDHISRTSGGKQVAQYMLLGNYGSLKYSQAKAHGSTTGKAVVKAALSQTLNNVTLGAIGAMEKRGRKVKP